NASHCGQRKWGKVLNRAGERGQIFSPSGRGAGGRFLNFVAPVLIFQRNAPRGACVIAVRGCAQSPPDNPQGPPRDKQEEVVSAPGPSIDPARAGGALRSPTGVTRDGPLYSQMGSGYVL